MKNYVLYHSNDEQLVKDYFHNESRFIVLNNHSKEEVHPLKKDRLTLCITPSFLKDFTCMKTLALYLQEPYEYYHVYTEILIDFDPDLIYSFWKEELINVAPYLTQASYLDYKSLYQIQYITQYSETLFKNSKEVELYKVFKELNTLVDYEEQILACFDTLKKELPIYLDTLSYLNILVKEEVKEYRIRYFFYKDHHYLGSYDLHLCKHLGIDQYRHIELNQENHFISVYKEDIFEYRIASIPYSKEELVEYCWHEIQKYLSNKQEFIDKEPS